MCMKTFSVFAILAIPHYQFTQLLVSGLPTSTLFAKGFELASALKYGDDCSWEAEKFRLNYAKVKVVGFKMADEAETKEFFESIARLNYSLCSGPDLFICDEESQKCVCGDVSYEALNGINRSLYTLEDGNKCRWKLDTYCVLDGQLNKPDMVKYDSKCKSGTSCRTREGDICSIYKMIHHILRNGGRWTFPTPRSIAEEMFAGKICACKSDPIDGEGKRDTSNSKDDTIKKKDIDGTHIRSKHYISGNV